MTRDQTLLMALKGGTLDARDFSHADHIRVAFMALKENDFFTALHLVATGIASAATRAGAPEKFNATITLAYVSEIAERMETAPCDTAEAFIRDNPDLLKGSPLSRYSSGRSASAMARRVALLPDLLAPLS